MMNRCGVCNGPTMTGSICSPHWKELDGLLAQCAGIDSDLDAAVGKRLRFGERVRRGTAQGLLVSPVAVEAKTVLEQVLRGAGRALGLPVGDLSAGEAATLLRTCGRLRGSWVAPALLGELSPAVAGVLRVVDRPRGRVVVRVPCPKCAGGPLVPVMGALGCRECGGVSSVREVRAGC